MNIMSCIIYKIINICNQKVYIGQTWSSMDHRFGQHTSSNSCIKLSNAIKKYGKENFNIEMIVSVETQELADQMEIFYINQFDSVNIGYNIHPGGRGGKLTEGTKKKLSDINKGKIFTEETRQKMSKAKKGISPKHKGKRTTSTTGIKGTKPWNTGTKGIIPWNKGRKQIPLLTTEQEIAISKDERSSRVLAKEYGVSRSHILNIIKKYKKSDVS